MDLSGKTVAITGGGGILCSAIARGLAGAGAAVGLMNRNVETSEPVAQAIREGGGRALALSTDVLSTESLEHACSSIEESLGGIDVLINGAGGNQPGATASRERAELADLESPGEATTFFDLKLEGFQSVFDVNFMGTVRATQVFARRIARRGGGSVLNISSMAGFSPLTKVAGYSAAKAAVSNFTQWLAVHLAPLNIRVNAIAPGFFLTEQNRFLLTDETTGELSARGRSIIEHTPLGRFGEPRDLVGVCLCLVSEAGSFITGTVVPIDGGFSAYSGV